MKIMRWKDGVLSLHADFSHLARCGMNDMLVDPTGRAYAVQYGFDWRAGEKPVAVGLLTATPDGEAGIAAPDVLTGNGMALSPDGRTFYIAESGACRISAFDRDEEGNLSNRRLFAQLPDGYYPDGICIDDKGAVWASCCWGPGVVRIEEGGRIADHDLDAKRFGAGAEHLNRLRVAARIDEKRGARRSARALGQRHRLRGGRRLIEERRGGDRHAREVADHRLEVDERLHPALADLSLVGRVGGGPRRVFEDVAQDHRGRVAGVIPLTDEAREEQIARGDALEFRERQSLGQGGRQPHRVVTGDRCRHDLIEQAVERRGADGSEHGGLIGRARADVPAAKLGCVFERGER